MTRPVLVVGATGNVGGATVDALRDRGLPVRATRDVGAVAAAVFADPGPHRGRCHTLTGPRAVDFAGVATILTAALRRAIRYEPATVLGYVRHLRRRGLPAAQVAVQTALHTGLRRGAAATVDPTLEQLLGRPARTLEQYVTEHAGTWGRAPA